MSWWPFGKKPGPSPRLEPEFGRARPRRTTKIMPQAVANDNVVPFRRKQRRTMTPAELVRAIQAGDASAKHLPPMPEALELLFRAIAANLEDDEVIMISVEKEADLPPHSAA
jgi:hypothetical protein